MMVPRLSFRACLAAALATVAAPSAADTWEIVVRDRGRQVEIDRGSIIHSDGGTRVAWGRIALSEDEAQGAGYAMVKALNRYDCANRSFFTVKRVYLDRRSIVLREESVADQKPIPVVRNTVDERLWREVCRPPSVSELRQVAREAGQSAARAEGRPAVREADEELPGSVALRPADLRRTDGPPLRGEARRVEALKQPASTGRPAPSDPPGRAAAAEDRSAGPAAQAPAAAPPVPHSAGGERAASVAAASPALRPSARAPERAVGSPVVGAPAAPRSASTATSATKATATSPSVRPASETRWSYEGDTGPEHWGRLHPEWVVCGEGRRQSPIDLADGIAVDLEPLRFDYYPARFRAADTGKTLEVRVGDGMAVEIRGRRYALTHIELHRPSEARIEGRVYDMAVHLHHRDADGHLAIVAVMLERGGLLHPFVQALWNNLPLERGDAYMPAVTIDPATLIPEDPRHYLYMGSLTTPPCTEGVLWAVMGQPVPVSDEQIRIFARLYPRNSRPVQPANGRLVLQSR